MTDDTDHRIKLEPSQGVHFQHDDRPSIPEPPPVRLNAVADVHLPAAAGREPELDAFYIGVLKFIRDDGAPLAYRAENFSIVFDVLEPPIGRDALQPTGIEVLSLSELRDTLIANEIGFESVHGMIAGHDHFLLQDPAGNWLQIGEWRIVR